MENFVVLDCEVYFEISIILGRPFLAIGRALGDMQRGEIEFRLNNKEVTFNILRTMKNPIDMRMVLVINCVDDLRVQPCGHLDKV